MTGIRFFVELADQSSAKLKEIEEDALKDLQFYKEQMESNKQQNAPTGVKLKTGLKVAAVGWGYSTIVVGSFLVEGMAIDVLRVGEGWNQGAWGKTQDLLRGLAIVGPLVGGVRIGGRAVAAIPKLCDLQGLAKAVDVNAKTGICGWVAAARSLRLSGQRIFITVQDLAKARGLSAITADTAGIYNIEIYNQIFQKLKIDAALVKLPKIGKMLGTAEETSSIAELEKAVRAAADDDIVMFSLYWYEGVEVKAHTVLARKVGGAIEYIERTGETVKSIGELPSVVEHGVAAGSVFPQTTAIIIRNASIVPTAGTVAAITPNFLNVLAVRVVPTVITPMENTVH